MGRPLGAKNKRFAGRPKSEATKHAERRQKKRERRRAAFEERIAWRKEAKAINNRDGWLKAKGMVTGGDEHKRLKAIHELAKGGNKTVKFDGRGHVEVNGETYGIKRDLGTALRGDDAAKLNDANVAEKKIQDRAQKKLDEKAAADLKKDEAHLLRQALKNNAKIMAENKKREAGVRKQERENQREIQRMYKKELAAERKLDRDTRRALRKRVTYKIPKGHKSKGGKAKKPVKIKSYADD